MAQLNVNHPGLGIRAYPCDGMVAAGTIGREDWLDRRRDPHALIRFIPHMEWANPRRDRMSAFRSEEQLLPAPGPGSGPVTFRVQEVAAAHHLFVPPGPFLIT